MPYTRDIPRPLSAERQLVLAVLQRSLLDLKPNASALDRRASVAFFSNADGWLETLCDLAGVEYIRVQELARARYPDGDWDPPYTRSDARREGESGALGTADTGLENLRLAYSSQRGG